MSAPRLLGTNGLAASKSATGNFTPHSALRGQKSPLSPQKNQRRREPNNASTSVKHAPPPDHAACFSRGGARRRVHQTAVGWHDHEDRVGPIYKQDDGSEQPTPLEGAEKGNDPEEPAERSRGSPASCSRADRPASTRLAESYRRAEVAPAAWRC